MQTAISSPTTHSFYFNILKDYLSFLLASNIATFLIIKADSFSVSAVCQLQLFEENTHVFTGFFPQSQPSKLSKWGEPCTALFPCIALEHWHAWTWRSWEQRQMEGRSYPWGKGARNWKVIVNSVTRHIPLACLHSETRPYKSANSRGSSRALIESKPMQTQ